MKKLYILILVMAPTFMFGQVEKNNYEFETGVDGFTSLTRCNMSYDVDKITVTPTKDSNCQFFQTSDYVDASNNKYLEIRLKNNNKGFSSIKLKSGSTVIFTGAIYTDDADFVTYIADLSAEENWTDNKVIGFIFTNSDADIDLNSIEIDYIRFTSSIATGVDMLNLPVSRTEKNTYEFTTGTGHDGFDNQTRCSLTDELDNVKLLNIGSTTQFYSFAPSLFYVDATANKHFAIKLQNKTTLNNTLRITYTDTDGSNPGFVEGVITTEDTGYTTYIVDLTADPVWDGNKLIKFTVKASSDTYDIVNTIDIDYIRFTSTAETGIDLLSTASIDDVDFKDDASIQLYPNPVQSTLRIIAPNTIYKIEIYNVLGQHVLESNGTSEMDVQSLNKGVYISKIFMENDRVSTKRFIID